VVAASGAARRASAALSLLLHSPPLSASHAQHTRPHTSLRSDGEPGSPGDSGGGGASVRVLGGKEAAPAVDTTGLALVDNRAVASASTRMLLRE
jgi:hypothetical protein